MHAQTIPNDNFDSITLRLEQAQCLIKALCHLGFACEMEDPWFEHYLISLSIADDLIGEARKELSSQTSFHKKEAA